MSKETVRKAIVDGDGGNKLVTVVATTADPTKFGLVICNADGSAISGGGGSSIVLKTNGTNNGSQSILNLKQGTNVTLTDDGVGGVTINATGGGGSGDVVGPASSVNNRVVFFDGITGKLIKDSGLTLSGTNTGDQDLTPYFNKSVDDTDDITEGAIKKFATAAEKTKLSNITVTQPVDLDQMEIDIAALANGMIYKGNWDASVGTFPGTGAAKIGWFYTVSVGGTVDGQVFNIGDRLIAIANNASTTTFAGNWSILDATDAVTSVFGRVGNIVSTNGDYTASQVTNVAAGSISAVTVQAAINELDTEKEPVITATTSADYYRGDKTFQPLNKAAVGLSNVDNTSDATKNSAVVALTNKDLTSGTNTFPTLNQNTTGSAATLTTGRTISGTGEATFTTGSFNGSSNVSGAVTLTNSAVIGKVLTGYTSGSGTVAATDTILQAIQKLNGNDALKATAGAVASSGLTMATNKLLGRGTAATGAIEEITLGTNLSFTGTTLNAAGGGISDGDKGDITVSGSGATWTIDNDVVTFAKQQNITTNKLLGRGTAGTGDIEEITLGSGLSFTGTTLNATTSTALSATYTLSNVTTDRTLDANSTSIDELADVLGTVINDMLVYTGIGARELRVTIPGEVIQDSSNSQGLFLLNTSGSSITISNVAVKVGTAAAGSGAACSVNVYKSSGTDADGINTSAVALFSSAIALGTGYSSLTNVPNTVTVENGRWLSVRVTSSAGATNKASDLQVVITR